MVDLLTQLDHELVPIIARVFRQGPDHGQLTGVLLGHIQGLHHIHQPGQVPGRVLQHIVHSHLQGSPLGL